MSSNWVEITYAGTPNDKQGEITTTWPILHSAQNYRASAYFTSLLTENDDSLHF